MLNLWKINKTLRYARGIKNVQAANKDPFLGAEMQRLSLKDV